jgi:transposase-like protein
MKQSRTALALNDVQVNGMSIAEAAKKHGIVRQSIYRLITYRNGRKPCPVCGSLVSGKQL